MGTEFIKIMEVLPNVGRVAALVIGVGLFIAGIIDAIMEKRKRPLLGSVIGIALFVLEVFNPFPVMIFNYVVAGVTLLFLLLLIIIAFVS